MKTYYDKDGVPMQELTAKEKIFVYSFLALGAMAWSGVIVYFVSKWIGGVS